MSLVQQLAHAAFLILGVVGIAAAVAVGYLEHRDGNGWLVPTDLDENGADR